MPSGAKLKYKEELKGKLRNFGKQMPRKTARAAKVELEIEKRESMRRTPKLTGAAAASHKVSEPIVTASGVTIEVTAGDEKTETYIVPLHENLTAFHPNGQAKFLESTMNESAPYIAGRIARRVELDESWLSPKT